MFNRILKIQICLLSIFCYQAVAGQNSNAVISLDYVGVYSWDKVTGKRNGIDDGNDRIISGAVQRAVDDSIQALYVDGSAGVMVEIFIKNISVPIAGMELSFEYSAATDSTFGFYKYLTAIMASTESQRLRFGPDFDRFLLSFESPLSPSKDGVVFIGEAVFYINDPYRVSQEEFKIKIKKVELVDVFKNLDIITSSNEIIFTPVFNPGDFNGDLIIDWIDFSAFARAYGLTPTDPNYDARMDLDNNGVINILDFMLLAEIYGKRY